MKKTLLFIIFLNCSYLALFAQKEFKLNNSFKTKIVKQTDYFTFYLKNKDSVKMNRVEEGYLLEARDKKYLVDVFLEEYETTDSLVLDRCNIKQTCSREAFINNNDIVFFQHNKRAKIAEAKILFGLSALSILTTSVFAFNPSFFEKNGELDSNSQFIAVGSGVGIAILSFGLGIKLLNPKKYYTTQKGTKGGWFITE